MKEKTPWRCKCGSQNTKHDRKCPRCGGWKSKVVAHWPDQIDHARAARCYLDATRDRNGENNREAELAAFLSIFHPNMKESVKRKLIGGAK